MSKNNKAKAPASAVALQIVKQATREDCSAAEIGALAQSDPAFGMRVLSMVNNPAFALSRKVDNVRQAVNLLGVRGLRNLALSLLVSDMAPSGPAGKVLLANSLRRGLAARFLADALGRRDTDAYFTAGLFLEAGLLVKAGEDAENAAELARSPAAHRELRERARGEEVHSAMGAELARSYHLAEDTIVAIEKHHEAVMPEGDVAGVCWVAERIAAVFEGGDLDGVRSTAEHAAENLGLNSAAVEKVLAELPDAVKAAAGAFEREVDDQLDIAQLALDANRSLIAINEQYLGIVQQLEEVIAEKESLELELRYANERLEQLATTDALTGLSNKRAFTEAIERDLHRSTRDESDVSLIVIDVDHFKKFNDTWGHAVGDQVLRTVGQLLLRSVRASDFAARYGGEEFVVLLPNTDSEGAVMLAQRLRARLAATSVQGPQGPLRVTASFGVATVAGPTAGCGPGALFERADGALYEAKRNGRNRVELAPDAEAPCEEIRAAG